MDRITPQQMRDVHCMRIRVGLGQILGRSLRPLRRYATQATTSLSGRAAVPRPTQAHTVSLLSLPGELAYSYSQSVFDFLLGLDERPLKRITDQDNRRKYQDNIDTMSTYLAVSPLSLPRAGLILF